MGKVIITANVHTGQIGAGVDDASESEGEGDGGHWEVLYEAGACVPCMGNDNPQLIPFPGCRGNLEIIAPRSGKGNLCRCRKRWVND